MEGSRDNEGVSNRTWPLLSSHGVLYWERHRRGRIFGPRRRGGLPADTPQLDGATPLCVAAPRKSETRSQRSHDRRRTSRFRLRNAPFRAVVVVGLPWGEEDQEDLLHHQRRLRRARANFLATVEKALAKIRMFLAKNPTLFSEAMLSGCGRQSKIHF